MKKKLLLLLILVTTSATIFAQEKNYYIEPKLNIAGAAIAIFNPALEIGFGKRSAVNFDYVGIYAKKNYMGTGYPFLLSMVTFDYRVYVLNKLHKGLFFGGGMGLGSYKMNKNIIPFVSNDKPKNAYDWGTNVMLGATAGYKFLIKDRFGIEISVTGGWQHSQHEVYNSKGELQAPMNASGEWTAYKGGVYFTYRF